MEAQSTIIYLCLRVFNQLIAQFPAKIWTVFMQILHHKFYIIHHKSV